MKIQLNRAHFLLKLLTLILVGLAIVYLPYGTGVFVGMSPDTSSFRPIWCVGMCILTILSPVIVAIWFIIWYLFFS